MDMLTFILDAAAGDSGVGAFGSANIIFLAAIIGIFYFFIIRPQSKRAKEQKQFRENLSKGDKVKTIGGIHGQIESMDEHTALVRVDSNTKIRLDKSALIASNEATGNNK